MSRLLPLEVEMPRFYSGQIVDLSNFVYVLFGIIAVYCGSGIRKRGGGLYEVLAL